MTGSPFFGRDDPAPTEYHVPPDISYTRRHKTPAGRLFLSLQAIWQALHPEQDEASKLKA
jgi:hypothetical protein